MKKDYLVFDIGGTQIKYGVFNQSGQLLEKNNIPTPKNFADFQTSVQSLIDKYTDTARGVAFSLPGRIDQDQNVIFGGGALSYNHERKLTEIFDFKGMMYAMENDAKVSVLAEKWLGKLTDVENAATVVLGTGIGGGLLIDNKPYRGSNYCAGELSIIIPGYINSPKQFATFSGSAVLMIKAVNERVGNTPIDDGYQAFELINSRDERIWDIFTNFCQTIAYVIFNLQITLDLDKVLVGGGISSQPIVVETIREYIDKLYNISPILRTTVMCPNVEAMHFKGDANLYGALYNLFLKYDISDN